MVKRLVLVGTIINKMHTRNQGLNSAAPKTNLEMDGLSLRALFPGRKLRNKRSRAETDIFPRMDVKSIVVI